ncbi:hypothetical protein FRB95_010064 [Tulasnella sp. JGI-2019a]|nr:hypothetical protein FRB93_005816 [Tulasnella sp. JGI-2019a]KAG9025538.1 hypothetical protein FRB95_010064 [Tulasnella sp. JGI-2019a]
MAAALRRRRADDVDLGCVWVSDDERQNAKHHLWWKAAMEDIKNIACSTTCTPNSMDITEAILGVLVTDGQNRYWGNSRPDAHSTALLFYECCGRLCAVLRRMAR